MRNYINEAILSREIKSNIKYYINKLLDTYDVNNVFISTNNMQPVEIHSGYFVENDSVYNSLDAILENFHIGQCIWIQNNNTMKLGTFYPYLNIIPESITVSTIYNILHKEYCL